MLTPQGQPQEASALQKATEKVVGAVFPDDQRLNRMITITPIRKDLEKLLNFLAVNPAQPLVVLIPGPLRETIEKEPLLAQLLRFPNVRTAPVHRFVAEASLFYTRPKTVLGKDVSKIALDRTLSVIRHDLRHVLEGSSPRKDQLLARARKEAGLKGSDDELIEQIMTPDAPVEVDEFFELNAACVDWEGTLMKDGKFNKGQLSQARTEAKKRNLPLIIWTGANPNGVYKELQKSGITNVDVCSKQDCRGLRAALAIDDTDLVILKKEFGLDAREFIMA
ncbi:hypothetical protein KJ951_03130 [Patescibacteria group bacterium]|nr:hypothetical protein [Patescibacteria group bacterium]MBU1703372.1 hypothetical protein [Patescibacteria group bacterium]MBU1954069.1 hypothetical protein [Patescibacteria group bacterium]